MRSHSASSSYDAGSCSLQICCASSALALILDEGIMTIAAALSGVDAKESHGVRMLTRRSCLVCLCSVAPGCGHPAEAPSRGLLLSVSHQAQAPRMRQHQLYCSTAAERRHPPPAPQEHTSQHSTARYGTRAVGLSLSSMFKAHAGGRTTCESCTRPFRVSATSCAPDSVMRPARNCTSIMITRCYKALQEV